MSAQIIERGGEPEYAVLPYAEYLRLVEDAEMLNDIRAYDHAKATLARGEDELVPAEVVDRLLDNDNPIRVWREYRGLTQAQLARAAGITVSTTSYIESGARKPLLIGDLDIISVFDAPLETNMPLTVDADTILPSQSPYSDFRRCDRGNLR